MSSAHQPFHHLLLLRIDGRAVRGTGRWFMRFREVRNAATNLWPCCEKHALLTGSRALKPEAATNLWPRGENPLSKEMNCYESMAAR